MQARKLIKKIANYSLIIVLTIGVIAAFGILSASGMLLVSPSIALAVGAFIFGGVVEGEVFKQEIQAGLEDLKLLTQKGHQFLVIQALEKELKNKSALEIQASDFLTQYKFLQNYLQLLRGKKLTSAQKKQRKEAKKRLKLMQQRLMECLAGNDQSDIIPTTILQSIKAQQNSFKWKMIIFRLSLPLSIACGLGFGFAVSSSLSAAFTLIGIGTSLSFLVWPLAVIAAIGYTLLIFHTVKDLVLSDAFAKWIQRIKRWFTPEQGKMTPKFLIKSIATALVIAAITALCVVATLATAGTWWIAVKNGAKLIPFLKCAAQAITVILTPLLAMGNFIFSIFNSFESWHVVLKAIKSASIIIKLKEQWHLLREQENWLQIINPFRLISRSIQKTADLILLLGHVTATGAARDQFLNISPTLLAAAAAGSELTQDVTFFFEENKKTMTQRCVMILISPLLLLSACWQAAASYLNAPDKRVSWRMALQHAFEYTPKVNYNGPDLNDMKAEWRTFAIQQSFHHEIMRLNNAFAKQITAGHKIKALVAVQNELIQKNRAADLDIQDNLSILKQPRFFGSQPRKTRSSEFAERMIHQFSKA